jgi:hypothetical protein
MDTLDVVGMTKAAHHGPGKCAGWRPRSPRDFSMRRPAPPKGPAAPAAGWHSAEENWSRAMKTKLPDGCLAKSRLASTRAAGVQDGSDECHDHDQPMRGRRPFPTMGSEAEEKGYALWMPAQGKGTL